MARMRSDFNRAGAFAPSGVVPRGLCLVPYVGAGAFHFKPWNDGNNSRPRWSFVGNEVQYGI
jgi:hypothetical protein